MDDKKKYMRLLAGRYPTVRSLTREIINLTAILNLPKGTEHFMSDIHGEYEAFCHILNNCSGVIREKVDMLYRGELSHEERKELCSLIYYPKEKLHMIRQRGEGEDWYRDTINRLIELSRALSSKYTRSKVRKAMPEDYAYILDELMHAQRDEDDNQIRYHKMILDTVIELAPDDFICSLAELIKRLAVDRLHIVGDIFDRGDSADSIIELLMRCESLDIEWGNHDILWMGAACGSEACIANVVRNSVKYNTLRTLESGYGVSLRQLAMFASSEYPDLSHEDGMLKAISVIQFKCEGQAIRRNPYFGMDDRLLLDKIDKGSGTVEIGGRVYALNDTDFPTVTADDAYALSEGERMVMDGLKESFLSSERLKRHIAFMYEKGGMYRRYNENLLYHGCVPLREDGSLDEVALPDGTYKGRELFERADSLARRAFCGKGDRRVELDFMWYLWCGRRSPLCGRNIKTFERTFIDDKSAWIEEKNPYYSYYYNEITCDMILSEFGLTYSIAHIVNGHTPVRTTKGELPIRANGRLLVIDGGFCREYHQTTGIAGYTLIYNSHGLRLKAHEPFESVDKAVRENIDIHSSSEIVETERRRVMVGDTDDGERIRSRITDLYELLELYHKGEFSLET